MASTQYRVVRESMFGGGSVVPISPGKGYYDNLFDAQRVHAKALDDWDDDVRVWIEAREVSDWEEV